MLNRPRHVLQEPDTEAWWDCAWEVDRYPLLRLGAIYLAILLPLVVIIVRVGYLQMNLPEVYVSEFTQTTERLEEIPAPNGRILAADGQVLAEDVVEYTLLVHYPWLQETPDPLWLKQQARARLTPTERRQPERVQREMDRIGEQHQQLWDRLAQVTQMQPEDLLNSRRKVELRIERIRRSVLNRQEAADAARKAAAAPVVNSQDDLIARVWQTLVHQLSSPPERTSRPPLIVQEERDYHPLLTHLPVEVAREIMTHQQRYPGLRIQAVTRRNYPAGPLASHLIGYRQPVSPDDLKQREERYPDGDPLAYRQGEWMSRTGLEKFYERQLRGLPGLRRMIVNRRGEVLRTETVRREQPGQDLELSLHIGLQQSAEKLLDQALGGKVDPSEESALPTKPPAGGSIVVLDVRTGEVLTAASAPRFDLNLFVQSDNHAAWQAAVEDPRRPFFPRVTRMALPPGSVFKVISATALLHSPHFDPRRPFECQGYLHVPTKDRCLIFAHYGTSHGAIDLMTALAQSCNVYFYHGAEDLGPRPLVKWAESYGLGQPTGIDLPGEQAGHVPLSTQRGQPPRLNGWNPGDTRHLAIGQSTLLVTPLQVARVLAAIANGGQLVTPRLARALGPAIDGQSVDGSPVSQRAFLNGPEPQPLPGLDSPESLTWIRRGLEAVVGQPGGTGYKTVRLKEVAIAGKTGTAEAGNGQADHAWFAGYVPAEQPRYAFVVVLEHAGSGGKIAGPVARKLVESMLDQGLLVSNTRQVTQADEPAQLPPAMRTPR